MTRKRSYASVDEVAELAMRCGRATGLLKLLADYFDEGEIVRVGPDDVGVAVEHVCAWVPGSTIDLVREFLESEARRYEEGVA